MNLMRGKDEALALQGFNAMLVHGTIGLDEDVGAHLDDVAAGDAEEITVEGSVVKLAEGDAVRDDGLAFGVAVGDDVSGVKKLLMFQSTEGALFVISPENPLAE